MITLLKQPIFTYQFINLYRHYQNRHFRIWILVNLWFLYIYIALKRKTKLLPVNFLMLDLLHGGYMIKKDWHGWHLSTSYQMDQLISSIKPYTHCLPINIIQLKIGFGFFWTDGWFTLYINVIHLWIINEFIVGTWVEVRVSILT